MYKIDKIFNRTRLSRQQSIKTGVEGQASDQTTTKLSNQTPACPSTAFPKSESVYLRDKVFENGFTIAGTIDYGRV